MLKALKKKKVTKLPPNLVDSKVENVVVSVGIQYVDDIFTM